MKIDLLFLMTILLIQQDAILKKKQKKKKIIEIGQNNKVYSFSTPFMLSNHDDEVAGYFKISV